MRTRVQMMKTEFLSTQLTEPLSFRLSVSLPTTLACQTYFSKTSYWFTYQSFSTTLLIDEVYYSIHWTSKCLRQMIKNGCSSTPMWPSMKACSPKQKNRRMIDHYAYTITAAIFCLFPILKFPTQINGFWFGFSHQGSKKIYQCLIVTPRVTIQFNSCDW